MVVAERLPSPMESRESWMTTRQAARRLGVADQCVRELAADGALTTWHLPGRRMWLRVLRADVERMAESAVSVAHARPVQSVGQELAGAATA